VHAARDRQVVEGRLGEVAAALAHAADRGDLGRRRERRQVLRVDGARLQPAGERQQQLGDVARGLQAVGARAVVELAQPQEFDLQPQLLDLQLVALA
jgi:hypothetical protein